MRRTALSFFSALTLLLVSQSVRAEGEAPTPDIEHKVEDLVKGEADTPAEYIPSPFGEAPTTSSPEAATAPVEELATESAPSEVVSAPAENNEAAVSELTKPAQKKEDAAAPQPAKANKKAADKVEPAADDAEAEDEGAGGGSAVLSAGGVVLSGKGFPLGVSLSTGASLGTGWLLPGFKRQPLLSPWLSIAPNFTVPKFVDWQPTLAVSGSLGITIPNMFGAYQRAPVTGPYQQNPHISDARISLLAPGLLTDKWLTGVSVTPLITATAPLSLFSRQMGRAGGISGLLQVSWASASAPFLKFIPSWMGVFGAQYRLGLANWFFARDSQTYRCEDEASSDLLGTVDNLASNKGNNADYPLGIPREQERNGDGTCNAPGRQWVNSSSNSFALFYSIDDPMGGNHVIRGSLGISNLLFRPLTNRDDLRSENAVGQSWFNGGGFSSGAITYGYQAPAAWVFDQNIQAVVGMSSFQPLTDAKGQFYFPWFDFSFGNQFTGLTASVIWTL